MVPQGRDSTVPTSSRKPCPCRTSRASFASRRRPSVPLATGEHVYGRWEVEQFFKADALQFIQADPEWCGGVSETVKIAHLASVHGVKLLPHCHNVHAALHIVASQSPAVCPMGEYLINHVPEKLWFLKDPPLTHEWAGDASRETGLRHRVRCGEDREAGYPHFHLKLFDARTLHAFTSHARRGRCRWHSLIPAEAGGHHRQPPDRRVETGARRRSGVPRAVQGARGDQHHALGGLLHRSVQCDEGAPERGGLRGRTIARHRSARTGRRTAISIAVLPGTDPKLKPILLLAHIDVVEANRADWERDPFKLVEEDGFFYARGSADDKAMAAVFADSLVRFKKEGYRPKRTIKLALTCGEETPNVFNGVKLPHRKSPGSHRRGLRAQRRRWRAIRPGERRVSLCRGADVREGLPGLHV